MFSSSAISLAAAIATGLAKLDCTAQRSVVVVSLLGVVALGYEQLVVTSDHAQSDGSNYAANHELSPGGWTRGPSGPVLVAQQRGPATEGAEL